MACIFHIGGFTDFPGLDFIVKGYSILWIPFKTVWFILGNYWVYTDTDCASSKIYIGNSNLWNFSLSLLIANYFCIVLGIALLLLYCFLKT